LNDKEARCCVCELFVCVLCDVSENKTRTKKVKVCEDKNRERKPQEKVRKNAGFCFVSSLIIQYTHTHTHTHTHTQQQQQQHRKHHIDVHSYFKLDAAGTVIRNLTSNVWT
jgi:hypothetical protein